MDNLNRRDLIKLALTTGAALLLPLPLSAKEGMATRTIISTGTELGVIGYGSGWFFEQENTENIQRARELIDILLEAGGNYVDTSAAAVVRNLSRWLEEDTIKRLFIVNTISEYGTSTTAADWQTLPALHRKKILDFAQIRNGKSFQTMRESWRFLQQLKEQGKVRNIGYTLSRPTMYELAGIIMKKDAPDFIQVNYSLVESEADERLLPMAKDLGVGVITNRPFMNGDYFKLVRGKSVPEWAKEFDCETWGQFTLKYTISHPAVTCVITESSKPKHARDNVRSGFGRLPNENQRQKMRLYMQSL